MKTPMKKKSKEEIEHEKMLELLLPLVAHLTEGDFTHFILIQKNGTASTYTGGTTGDIVDLLNFFVEKYPQFRSLLKIALADL